jgi:hypothetical protein
MAASMAGSINVSLVVLLGFEAQDVLGSLFFRPLAAALNQLA